MWPYSSQGSRNNPWEPDKHLSANTYMTSACTVHHKETSCGAAELVQITWGRNADGITLFSL
jgi:hypothetical protein